MTHTNDGSKSTVTAYLLWFFLGGFGAHRFYMGRKGSGFGMLGLCIGSVILTPLVIGLITFPALLVWWVVDAFLLNNWLKECVGNTGVVGTTIGEQEHRGGADHPVERDLRGGVAAGHDVARRIDMGEAMHDPAQAGDLVDVAGLEVALLAALDRPAEVVLDRHGEIDDAGHGGALLGRSSCAV